MCCNTRTPTRRNFASFASPIFWLQGSPMPPPPSFSHLSNPPLPLPQQDHLFLFQRVSNLFGPLPLSPVPPCCVGNASRFCNQPSARPPHAQHNSAHLRVRFARYESFFVQERRARAHHDVVALFVTSLPTDSSSLRPPFPSVKEFAPQRECSSMKPSFTFPKKWDSATTHIRRSAVTALRRWVPPASPNTF